MSEPSDRAFDAVRRLSQYRPFEAGGASSREAVDDLVHACLAEADGCASIEECVDVSKTLFTVELHEVEIARSLGDLVEADLVERREGGFHLSKSEKVRLDQAAADSANVFQKAMDEWRSFILDRWPGLKAEELGQLENDLQLFLRQVLYRQGAEAAVLLYPDLPESQKVLEDLDKMGLDFLPRATGELREIRTAALSHLIRRPTESQKLWLGQQLNTTYFWRILSIDPKGAELVRDLATGQRVYLDTNLIYRLLGVQGPRYVRPAETIVKTTQEIGYECCVTPWTVREFRKSLKNAADFLKLYPLPSPDYADLLAEATSDDDFVTAYWRHVRDTGLQVEDFVAHYEEVEANLEQFDVKVVDEGCTAIEQRKTETADQVGILNSVLGVRTKPKHPESVAHDVKHRQLVQHLRGESNRRFANAGYWFLTFDSVLPRYDLHARQADGSDLPFCVSAGAWFQIVEALRPKTTDDLQLLADLLASPYVRYRRELSKETAQAIAARVHLHEGSDPRLAARILMNSALTAEIEKTEGEERIEKIDSAIVAAAHQAQEDARRAQEEAERAREEAAKAEEEAASQIREAEQVHAAEIRDSEERIEKARRDEAERGAKVLEEEEARHSAEIKKKQEEKGAAQASANLQQKRLRTVVALVVVFALAVLGLLAVGLSGVWAVILVVVAVIGLWTGIDRYWIRRGTDL